MSDRHHRRPMENVTTSDPVAFARAVEELPVGVIVYDGPDHVVTGANRTARAFFCDRPAIIGRPIREVCPEVVGQQLLAIQDRVFTTGEPFTATEWRIVVGDDGDGNERFVNFLLIPLREPDGRVSGTACQFVDVTDSVLHRQTLAADTAELRERFEAAQDVVLTLQRSLLQPGLPVLPGVRIAAHYLVASAEQAAGGDWFDAVPLGGRLVAVVGDVVGHGAEASAVMGQLRAVLEEFLLDGDDLAAVLARLDRFATRVTGARGATVCLALIDPADGTLRYACAGHPPPLVVSPDGTTRFLPAPGGGPLGVAGPAAVVGEAVLRAGELLLCYSDGLVEHPGEDMSVHLAGLAEVASSALRVGVPSLMSVDPAERVAELTVERMTRQGYQDDVTLLVVRLTGQEPAEFLADLPAEPGQLSVLRGRLEAWLTALGAGESDVVSFEIAVLEAVTNAIEHAYTEPGGRVRVEGLLDGAGRVCMTVIDHGSWRPAPTDPGHRGRGLMMMRGCMDTVEIDSSAEGTTLLLDRQLRRAPVLTPARRGARTPGHAASAAMSVTVARSTEPRVAVAGPIDLTNVAELRRQLWSASRGGALPLTVELDRVTHLASAGVQLLFEFVEEMSVDGRKVQFVAPPASAARHAIAVTGLDRIVAVTDA